MAKSDYFKRTNLFWMVSVTFAVGYFSCIVFAPELIPFQQLGGFGSFCKHLVDNYAGVMYKGKKGIDSSATRFLWFFQTFLFGFASLGLLLKYDPEHPKRR
ncbi:transmembrane protein 254 isoform X1 [Nothobranchius furzeri]|uniref:Transmembrane protein 254 n=1 Tax=Nothobranchius furzeri TaxID=105023 RepID=A0A9D2YK22_NOTFU|nr:transmembrane protein 254 isoform X2 [Nothobranchius furzeri]KAF7221447.1 transcript variant X2 [Nothobranchius furzeri]